MLHSTVLTICCHSLTAWAIRIIHTLRKYSLGFLIGKLASSDSNPSPFEAIRSSWKPSYEKSSSSKSISSNLVSTNAYATNCPSSGPQITNEICASYMPSFSLCWCSGVDSFRNDRSIHFLRGVPFPFLSGQSLTAGDVVNAKYGRWNSNS